jgi:TolA-binding protein
LLPRYVMPVQSLRDMIDRGVELKFHEAVAIVQQLITAFDADVPPSSPIGSSSADTLVPLSLDSVRLCSDGSVICCAGASPSVEEITVLFEAMLPRGGRDTIAAWSLGEVDAPPFHSLAQLSASLKRQEEGDRSVVLCDLYGRARAARPKVVALNRERRRNGPSVAELRHQLREADLELFLMASAAKGTVIGRVPQGTDSRREPRPTAVRSVRARRSRARTRANALVVGSAVAGLLVALAGVTAPRRPVAVRGLGLPPLPPSPWSGLSAWVRSASALEPVPADPTGVIAGAPVDLPRQARVMSADPDPLPRRTPRADVSSVEQKIENAQKRIGLTLNDHALDALREAAARRPNAAAYFSIASLQEAHGRFDNALAIYRDIARLFPDHARAPEAVFGMARCVLQSQRSSKTIEARALLGEVAAKYPNSQWAPRALIARGELEERNEIHQRDNILGTSVPAALVTYRQVVRDYPASPERATALWKLGQMYEIDKRYDRAAETFTELAQEYPKSEYDAWFRAAEIHDRWLKNRDRARATYERVPPMSPHFSEARKRLRELAPTPLDIRAPRPRGSATG